MPLASMVSRDTALTPWSECQRQHFSPPVRLYGPGLQLRGCNHGWLTVTVQYLYGGNQSRLQNSPVKKKKSTVVSATEAPVSVSDPSPVTPRRSSDQQRALISLAQTHPLGPRGPGDQQSLSFPGRLWPAKTNDSRHHNINSNHW